MSGVGCKLTGLGGFLAYWFGLLIVVVGLVWFLGLLFGCDFCGVGA